MSIPSTSSPLPLLFLLFLPYLLLPSPTASSSSPRTRPVFGTERYARSAPSPHRRLLLRPAPFLLRQPLPSAPRLAYPIPPVGYSRREDPLESYRAFVEQEEFPEGVEEEGEEEGDAESSPYSSSEYRHAMRGPLPPLYSLPDTPQYRFATPYTAYYERPSEMAAAYGRPATAASGPRRLAADPVEDLEEEMRQEEEAGGWASPWWGGGEAEEDGEEAEREAEREAEEEEEEAAAERAATDGAFLRNLILAQRYREDSLRPEGEAEGEGGKRRRVGAGRRGDSGDRAVKELESLAGKRSGPKRAAPERASATAAPEQTPAPTTPSHSSERGQKEVAVPRPASPPRRPLDAGLLVGRRWPEGDERSGSNGSGRSVYAALERLLEAKDSPSGALQRHNQRSLQKRFVTGEDVMMRQLNELKRA